MAALTKKEQQILKDFGNDPNYRIETNYKNKIVAIQLKPTKSNMQRFIDGEEFTLSENVTFIPSIKYRFIESSNQVVNMDGAASLNILAVFEGGFIYKLNKKSNQMSFADVFFVGQ